MPRFTAGSASVSVVPDLSGFQQTMTAQLSRMGDTVKVKVQPDLTGFVQQVRAEMARLSRDPVRIPVTPELDRAALARLQAQLSRTEAKVKVDVDTKGVASAGKALGALGSAGSAALAPLRTQAGAIAAGLLAIAPAAGQAAGALALLPALGVAAAAPIATLVIGAQGLGDAFKAFGTAAKESAAQSQANAAAAASAAKQHEAAQKAVQSAGRQVVAAERQVAAANRASQRAQEELTRAREEAVDRIEDLNLALRASALDEEAAILAVEKAREHLTETTKDGSEATALERREADLGYRQSVQSLDEIRVRNARLAEETAAANAAGVEGSDLVASAQERVTEAALSGLYAQEGVQQAQQQLADAVAELGSIATTAGAQTNSLADAMAKLSPVAQGFVTQIHALGPAWNALRFDVQDRLLAGLGDSITALADRQLPVLREGLGGVADLLNGGFRDALGVFSTASAAADFSTTFDNIREAMAPVTAAMGPLSQAFIDLATVGSGFLPQMGEQVGGLATRFSEWVASARESGELEAMIQRALDVLKQLGEIAGNVFDAINSIFTAGEGTGGSLLQILEQVTGAIAALFASAPAQEAMRAIFTAIGDVIAALLPIVSQLITALLPIVPVIADLITVLLPPLVDIFNMLIPVITMVVDVIGDALGEAMEAIAPLFPIVVDAFRQILDAIAPLIPMLVSMAAQLIPQIAAVFAQLWPVIVQLVQAFLPLIPIIADLVMMLIPPLLEIVEALLPFIGQLGTMIADLLVQAFMALKPLFPVLIDAFMRILEAVMPLLPVIFDLAMQLLPPLMAAFLSLVPVIMSLLPLIVDLIEWLAPLIVQILEKLTPAIVWLGQKWSEIFQGISAVVIWIVDHIVRPAFDKLKSGFEAVGDGLSWVYDNIIKPVWDGFVTGINWVKDAFGTAVDWIGRTWETLKDKMSGPIQWVIDFVWNNGLRKLWNTVNDLWEDGDEGDLAPFVLGFARGGVLPGYTPGLDVHRFVSPTGGILDLSGGEAIMRPEFTRALGVPAVNMLNELARREGVAGLRRALAGTGVGTDRIAHYADGGVLDLPGWLDTALDWVPGMGGVSDIVDAINGGTGWGSGMWGDALIGTARKAGSSIWDAIDDLWGGGDDESTAHIRPLGSGLVGAGFSQLHAEASRLHPGTLLTSGFRPGDPGFHGRRLAADLGWPGNNIGQLRNIQRKLHAAYPGSRELIGPAGPRLNLKNGRQLDYSAATQRDHQDHVHWVARNGGVLPPGLGSIYTGGGGPMALTAAQWDQSIRSAAGVAGPRGPRTVIQDQRQVYAQVDARRLAAAMRDEQRDTEFLHA